MFVSELITRKDIESWQDGDVVIIKTGTGGGKSTFIKKPLHDYAKENGDKILMLVHRRNCLSQFQTEIVEDGKTDVVCLTTYQYIDTRNRNKKRFNFDFSPYKYIVMDEFHYFMSDSKFNSFTDISLNAILNETGKIRIFMSATGDYVKHYLCDSKHKGLTTIDYELPIDFSFIEKLEFFHKNETLETYIEEAIKRNEKTIFFVYSAKQAYELHQKYKDHTLFNCSKSNKSEGKYYQYVDKDKIEKMLEEERFEELILITTTSLDTGVSLRDDELKHIVVANIFDTGTVIQCIGRKRLSEHYDEKITLRIKAISNQQLGGIETEASNEATKANYFRENGADKYTDKYYRKTDKSNIVYNEAIGCESKVEMMLNELMFYKIITELQEIEEMKAFESKNNYCEYISNIFKIGYTIIEEEEAMDELERYLDSVVGEWLYKDQQEELIEKVSLKDARGRVQRNVSLLNMYFKVNELKFLIVSKTTKIKADEGKRKSVRYWEVLDGVIES